MNGDKPQFNFIQKQNIETGVHAIDKANNSWLSHSSTAQLSTLYSVILKKQI